jgi:hypothetical protein
MAKIHYLLLVFAALAILASGCTQPTEEHRPAPVGSPVTITVPVPPVPVQSRDGTNLAYELELLAAGDEVFTPETVEVIDPDTSKVIYILDDALLASLYHPAADPLPSAAELQNGSGKVPVPRISLWFVVDPDAVPDRLVHRVTLNMSGSGKPPLTLTGGQVAVRKDLSPVVVGSPMRGPGWLALETTAPNTHHFSAQITMGGVTRVPQKYAQDWIYVDPVTGKAVEGDPGLARNYYGFGKEILSVANGTVVGMLDGLPDHERIYSPQGVTIATAAGNYVIVDIGDGKYACYAHMVNGSVRVVPGDRVIEGQVLGLMGNSGNSDLPHLHFQVVEEKASFLGAEGYPHVYRAFDVTGEVNQTRGMEIATDPDFTNEKLWSEFDTLVSFYPKPVHQQESLPENWVILDLP